MNILLVTTGGTIGSAFDGSSIDVSKTQKCAVAERYAEGRPDVRFDRIRPLEILSENISCGDFNRLAAALYQADLAAYDGVILTVGSDNLAYLASFVGLLFGSCGVPVCLVASDKVLSDPAANGLENFACAVELIRQKEAGVFVPYRNSDGRMLVHSAADIRQADLSDDFYSFHGAYGVFEKGVLHENRPYLSQQLPTVFDKNHLPRIRDNVLSVHAYPLQDYERLRADGVKAVLHTLYHSATLDAERFVPWMQRLSATPVFLASFRSARKMYRTAVDAVGAGAIPLYDISPECAYIKLLLACAQEEISIREFMTEL